MINNTYHSSISCIPSKLLLGYEQRTHTDSQFAQFVQSLISVDRDLEKERESNKDSAERATNLLRVYNKKYRDRHSKKTTKYKEGDYVLIQNRTVKPGDNAKLKPNYKGPYMIAKSLGNDRYVIRDIPGYNQGPKPMNTVLSSDKVKHWIKI